mmetsp:Transcript_19482/g.37609  ORF Transcript_19482/g.37609 Transcript_19482/m.37609 type:complete len:111 (-) Transcript_19482:18-350(-)
MHESTHAHHTHTCTCSHTCDSQHECDVSCMHACMHHSISSFAITNIHRLYNYPKNNNNNNKKLVKTKRTPCLIQTHKLDKRASQRGATLRAQVQNESTMHTCAARAATID